MNRKNVVIRFRRGVNMKLLHMAKMFAFLGLASLMTSSVLADPILAPISDLYNTGMSTPWDAAQSPIPGSNPGIASDTHWTVSKQAGTGQTITGPFGPAVGASTLNDAAFPFTGSPSNRFQQDLATDAYAQSQGFTQVNDSQWINRGTSPGTDQPGIYVFETTFTTTQPLTPISISGFFKAQDVLGIQLNGGAIVDPGSPHGVGSQASPLVAASPFTITGTGGLTNTLRFYVVRPGAGTAALRVEFTNATFAVPEPSTIVLGALGLVGFGATRLRRRFSKVKAS